MTHCDFPLFLDIRQPGTLVVDFEREDAVLIGGGEGCGVDGCVAGLGEGGGRGEERGEIQAVEGREHAEFELQGVVGREAEGNVVGSGVFGEGDAEGLVLILGCG